MTMLTSRLLLRNWVESDLTFLQKIRNDRELQALLLSTARGSSVSDVRQWITHRSDTLDKCILVIHRLDIESPIGYIQYKREPDSTDGFRFGICLAWEHHSKGYGSELLKWLDQHLLNRYSANKIVLYVEIANHNAIALYERSGFRHVGVMRRHKKVCDEWRDVVYMEKLLPKEAAAN